MPSAVFVRFNLDSSVGRIEITNAHGQDITKNTKARYIHVEKVAPGITNGGMIAKANAPKTTIGVPY